MNTDEGYNELFLYEHDKKELEIAIESLNYHMRNKKHFKPYVFSIHNKENLRNEDYSTKNVRLSYYINCELQNCNFFEAGFAGSVFVNTKFVDCNFDFSKFLSCDFRECEITFSRKEKCTVNSADFSNSIFSNCKIINAFLHSTNLEGIVFNNGEICDNKWKSVSLENAIINRTLLKNMRFASQNFDFSTFKDISTSNVVFPFPAMPYIFNGLIYVYNTNDDIRFTSCGNGINRIDKNEYISLMNQFKNYYRNTDNFFPLSNILIAEECTEEALKYIGCGIMQSIKTRNFRMLLNYCKLLETNFLFTIQHRKKLYSMILNEINKENLSAIDYEIFSLYIGKIKNILITNTNEPYAIIDIKTNIDSSETFKISVFIAEIEKMITMYIGAKEEHHIELRHNSLENFILQISSDPERLIIFLAAFFQCCGFVGKLFISLYKAAEKIIKKKEENNDSIEDNDYSNIIENYKNCSQNNSIINVFTQNNINIQEMNYCIFNTKDFDSNIQSAYIKNEILKSLK